MVSGIIIIKIFNVINSILVQALPIAFFQLLAATFFTARVFWLGYKVHELQDVKHYPVGMCNNNDKSINI